MSKAGEKMQWVSRRVVTGLLGFFSALPVCASNDQPDVAKFSANGWHESGWLSHGVLLNSDSGKPAFDNIQDMVFSPQYDQPVRKVILEAKCTFGSSPQRFLTVWPYVSGAEDASRQVAFEVVENWRELTILSLDFAPEDNVNAIRIGLTGSGSANWILTRLAVVYGEKTSEDDELMRTFARQLPTPDNLALTDLTPTSLTFSASAVADSVGYCFELTKLTGTPRTEQREDFVSAPNLSAGWTCDARTDGLTLSDGEKTYSDSAADDEHALKVEKATNPKVGPVELGFVSPLSTEPISEWSFVGRVGALDKSNRFAVYGRTTDTSDDWIELAKNLTPDKKSSNKQFKGSVDTALNIRQVRFVLTADAGSWTTTGLDSLNVVFGGNETRELVSAQTNTTPEATWQNLPTGRYGCRVKALGATAGESQFKDSSWLEEQVVDLAWAKIELTAPTDVVCQTVGDKLVVGWKAVPDAERYVVTVFRADDLATPMATVTTKSTTASVEVEELGEYVVKVTAVSPGNVSTATATVESYEIKLGKLTGLKAVATAADAIEATWTEVPMAEGYQAKLFKVEGDAGTVVADFSLLPDKWPEGWSSSSWLPENLSKSGLKFTYNDQWAATGEFPAGVTKVVLSVKSNSSVAERLDNQYLTVEVSSGTEDNWQTCATIAVAAQTVSKPEFEFPVSDNIRRIRFKAGTNDEGSSPAIQLGAVTVNYGNYTRTEVASVGVGSESCVATFGGLDKTGRYVVVVAPQPSEGADLEASSQIVDLASEYFRPVGPVSVAGCKGGVYVESFDSLAAVKAKLDLSRAPLKWWQLYRGSGAAQTLNYTAGTNSTSGGVYCYSDAGATTDSYMVGTVASGTIGCSLGIAFVNDTAAAIRLPTMTFTSVQRNFKANPASYVLEWLVTDGTWSIGTESENWKSLVIPKTAPFTSETQAGRDEYREACITLPRETGDEDYKSERLRPGQVVIFRWRHEKLANGPMMGIDDVHVEFPVEKPGFGVIFK